MPTQPTQLSPNRPESHTPIKRGAEADALFSSMGDGAITTDEYGTVTRINSAARLMLGFSENDIKGKSFLKTVIAITFEGLRMNVIDSPMTQAFLTGKPVSGKFYFLTKTGHHLPVAVNVSPIMIDSVPVGSIALIRDISLEYEVDRMKSEFISLASHQLRTPLSAIKTYTHMLADGYMGKLNREQKNSLETIIGATNRMNELISTLLNITKIESGTIAVNPKNINIKETIYEVLPELRLIADMKAIKVNVQLKNGSNLEIKTDTLIVKEVITNLVSNAIKYTPENGTVNIIITPKKSDVLVEINDNGWGIPAKSQDKIFSKFFRGSNIINKVTSGTGLGLYLVKGLVDTLNGKIWFVSQEGKGSSFYFLIPRTTKVKHLRVKN